MGNVCFSHCQKNHQSTKRKVSFVSFEPPRSVASSASDSEEADPSYYYDNGDDYDEVFYDSDAYVWFDAFENFPIDDDDDQEPSETSFRLSNAALKMIRTRLKDSFPNDRNFLNDDYIKTMACQAYLKDRNPRRAIETSIESLSKIMKWRDVQNLSESPHLVSMAVATKAQRQRWRVSITQLQKAYPLTKSLNTAGWYWHGLTKEGRPIMWIHTHRLSLVNDDKKTQAHMMALQLLADMGIQYGMSSGISNACVIIMDNDSKNNSANSTRLSKKFAEALVQALMEGYPYRIHQVWIGTTAPAAVAVLMDRYNGLIKQASLADTIILCETMKECRDRLVEQVLGNGWDDLPTFLGGPNANHDQWYPPKETENDDEAGESLTFDFYGMKNRMIEQRSEYEERTSSGSVKRANHDGVAFVER